MRGRGAAAERGLGHLLASMLTVLAASCATDVAAPSEVGTELSGPAVPISGEHIALMHKGLVSIQFQGRHRCTGVLISPYHALTAAHCTEQAGTGNANGLMQRTVSYYDPEHGMRPITAKMGSLRVSVVSTWDGLTHPTTWTGADVQDDLAILERLDADQLTPLAWDGTSSDDYTPIWLGAMNAVAESAFYGAGSATIAGELSSAAIRFAGSDQYYFWEIGDTRQLCKGDSGGPYLGSALEYGEVVLGLAVAGDGVTKTSPCSERGGKRYATRLSSRIDWIDEQTGGMCTKNGSAAFCF